jgi:hypothetical protein
MTHENAHEDYFHYLLHKFISMNGELEQKYKKYNITSLMDSILKADYNSIQNHIIQNFAKYENKFAVYFAMLLLDQ